MCTVLRRNDIFPFPWSQPPKAEQANDISRMVFVTNVMLT